VDERRLGVVSGLAAYSLWGLFPLYFPLLEPAGGLEIVAHRVLWSLLFVGILLTVLRKWAQVRALVTDRRRLLVLLGAAVLIAANWLVFVYGVNSGHVVETSLGYFINPLVSVLLGVVVFSERLRTLQWVAVGTAGVAVLVLTVDYGRPPWIALVLALTFGLYGLMKKIVRTDAAPGLFVETALVALPAAAVLAVAHSAGDGTFGNAGTGHALLLVSSGVATAVPLLLFAAAARRIPLSSGWPWPSSRWTPCDTPERAAVVRSSRRSPRGSEPSSDGRRPDSPELSDPRATVDPQAAPDAVAAERSRRWTSYE
jgi:chloramphenicol-sensitive protein RarD